MRLSWRRATNSVNCNKDDKHATHHCTYHSNTSWSSLAIHHASTVSSLARRLKDRHEHYLPVVEMSRLPVPSIAGLLIHLQVIATPYRSADVAERIGWEGSWKCTGAEHISGQRAVV